MHAALTPFRPQLPRAVTRRFRVLPQRQPNTERFAYAQALLAIQARAMDLLSAELVPQLPRLVAQAGLVHDAAVRANTYADEVARVLAKAGKELFGEFTNSRLRKTAMSIAQRTSGLQKSELARQLSSIYGKELSIDIFAEAGIKERLEAFAANNVLLVKNVPAQFYQQVGQQVVQGLRTGQRAEDLQAIIVDRYGVSQSRARLIARDQTGKIYGELNKARQQDLGIDSFTWRTCEDERVRPEHEELDGQSFPWDAPPSEGIPGEPVACRCGAEPNVQAMIDAL